MVVAVMILVFELEEQHGATAPKRKLMPRTGSLSSMSLSRRSLEEESESERER